MYYFHDSVDRVETFQFYRNVFACPPNIQLSSRKVSVSSSLRSLLRCPIRSFDLYTTYLLYENYPIDALTTPLLSVIRSVGSLTLHAALRISHPGFVTAIVRELPNNGATVNNGRRCPIISFRSKGNRRRDSNLREPLVVISVAPIDTLGRCTIKRA